MSATSLAHNPFRNMLDSFAKEGQTANERELARIALDIYDLSANKPSVAAYVDQFALRVMS